MTRYGYKLMSEEHAPRALVANACAAEDRGFDFVGISDHFHPWLDTQGHASFAWTVLGAIAVATERVGVMTAVTCPFLRYHPAVIAQAAATVALVCGERFTLGLGSGEALNERVVGRGWPHVSERQTMLEESIDIIQRLWSGERVSFRGEYLDVEAARIYDLPLSPPALAVAAGGVEAAEIAARSGGGLVATQPERALVERYREAGGDGPCYAEISLCWGQDGEQALQMMHERFRWSGLGWHVLPELAQPEAFLDATRYCAPEDLRDSMPHGPKLEPYLEAVRAYTEAGFDHLLLTQVGPDQAGFFEFWHRELQPALRAAA